MQSAIQMNIRSDQSMVLPTFHEHIHKNINTIKKNFFFPKFALRIKFISALFLYNYNLYVSFR